MQKVRCAYCRGIYDLGEVEVTARYADCSVWKSPCCGRTVDDRGETGWKSTRDYYPLNGREEAELAKFGLFVTPYGDIEYHGDLL